MCITVSPLFFWVVLSLIKPIIITIWVFPKIGVPQNGWFIMENPIKMHDLEVPLFLETPICIHWPYLTSVFCLHVVDKSLIEASGLVVRVVAKSFFRSLEEAFFEGADRSEIGSACRFCELNWRGNNIDCKGRFYLKESSKRFSNKKPWDFITSTKRCHPLDARNSIPS